jgi:hypothetical protein
MILSVSRILFPVPIIIFLLGMVSIDYNDMLAGIIMAIGLALFVILYFSLRCPTCRKSPYVRKSKNNPSIWEYSLPTAEKKCSQCGLEFSRAKIERQAAPLIVEADGVEK